MQYKTRNGKKKVVYERLAYLIEKSGSSQAKFAEVLTNRSGQTVSPASVSLWLTGRRSVPQKYIEDITNMFGVTEAYLLGMTDDPQKTWKDIEEEGTNKEELYIIDRWQLYAYDRKPIFVTFDNYDHEDGWAIYNRDRQIFIFADDVVRETVLMRIGAKFHTKDITELDDPLKLRNSLDLHSMMTAKNIYIHMNTSNRAVQQMYDGWYHHNEKHTALINEEGLVLPYAGLKKAYRAYSYNMTTKRPME